MAKYVATVRWQHDGGSEFARGHYSRGHTWVFDGGIEVPASASPHVVRAPWSIAEAVDPEEAFVAAIASCHMLTFLYVCSKQGFAVASYEDAAVGTMTKNEAGSSWVSHVRLAPRIAWIGVGPSEVQLERMHDEAHHGCFIANSVRTEITIAPPT